MTSILILFEMTNGYQIMLALMSAWVTSTLVYAALKRDSIYMVELRRKAIEPNQGRAAHLMESIPWRGFSLETYQCSIAVVGPSARDGSPPDASTSCRASVSRCRVNSR